MKSLFNSKLYEDYSKFRNSKNSGIGNINLMLKFSKELKHEYSVESIVTFVSMYYTEMACGKSNVIIYKKEIEMCDPNILFQVLSDYGIDRFIYHRVDDVDFSSVLSTRFNLKQISNYIYEVYVR